MVRILGHRVKSCRVLNEEECLVSEIGKGVVLYIGLSKRNDSLSNVDSAIELVSETVQKLISIDEQQYSKELEIMICSSIKLYSRKKGKRLDYHKAEDVEKSRKNFIEIVSKLKRTYMNVQRTEFRTFCYIEMKGVSKTVFLEN